MCFRARLRLIWPTYVFSSVSVNIYKNLIKKKSTFFLHQRESCPNQKQNKKNFKAHFPLYIVRFELCIAFVFDTYTKKFQELLGRGLGGQWWCCTNVRTSWPGLMIITCGVGCFKSFKRTVPRPRVPKLVVQPSLQACLTRHILHNFIEN